MKKLLLLLTLVVAAYAGNAQCCGSAKKSTEAKTSSTCCSAKQGKAEVKAYYFHATRRCATCEAVEKVAKATIAKYYNGKVDFVSINREEDKNSDLVKKYKVGGQTLLIVKGGETVNLTSAAFMNARTRPEKLEARIKTTIDKML